MPKNSTEVKMCHLVLGMPHHVNKQGRFLLLCLPKMRFACLACNAQYIIIIIIIIIKRMPRAGVYYNLVISLLIVTHVKAF